MPSDNDTHPLQRSKEKPTTALIATGFHDVRGTKIKHKVDKSALYLPRKALEKIEAKKIPAKLKGLQLPGLDAVVRPSTDPDVQLMTVTDVFKVTYPADPTKGQLAPVTRTYCKNRDYRKDLNSAPERIRGGGNEHGDVDMKTEEQPQPDLPPSSQAPEASPKVKPLDQKPPAQWEQHAFDPTLPDRGSVPIQPANEPSWFHKNAASSLEKSILPEWFNGSAPHRTEETFLRTRNAMMDMSEKLVNRFLTATMARRSVEGDAGSIIRVWEFLNAYRLINRNALNESAPTPGVLHRNYSEWTEDKREKLVQALVESSNQNQTRGSQLNWIEISDKVGMPAVECERYFLQMPMESERPVTPEMDNSLKESPEIMSQSEYLQSIVKQCHPTVLEATTSAALQATSQLGEAQKAAQVAVISSQITQNAQQEEVHVNRIMQEIVDLRLTQLEQRMSALEDVEAMLDAERIALELERRDLYTSRCRQWFGGS